jgi:hypothetical protein
VGYVVSRIAAPEPAAPNGTSSTSPVGTFEFKWPGGDCWKIYRDDVEVTGHCGGGKHVLQAGSYVVKPLSSEVFLPFAVTIKPGLTTSADASAGTLEFKWPGNDCWKIYRGDVEVKGSCRGGKHVLQAGSYVIKPSGSAIFDPLRVEVKRGETTSMP